MQKISDQVEKLEQENLNLVKVLDELREQIKTENLSKPRGCEYCIRYVPYYIRSSASNGKYIKSFDGFCALGRNKKRKADDTCKAFEIKPFQEVN